jgi:hypothetical protein
MFGGRKSPRYRIRRRNDSSIEYLHLERKSNFTTLKTLCNYAIGIRFPRRWIDNNRANL